MTIISAMNSLYERPQIQEAAAEARAAIPRLRKLFSARPLRASVLVRYPPPTGPSEVVWGRLLSISDSTVTCHIGTTPSTFPEPRSIQYSCAFSALLDWSVTTAEREARGGYTLKGMRQLTRDLYGDERARAFDKEMRRYVDWKDIATS